MQNSRLIKLAVLIIILVIFIAAINFRLTSYGDLRLSIGTLDTESYLRSADLPLLSSQFLEAPRPPTIPLLYKIFMPESGYELTTVSEPAVAGTPRDLALQPGFDRVVIAQVLLSILGWGALAGIFAARVKNPILKALACGVVLAFAFSPQLAEWDNILLSESLSFSLFALLLALTLEIFFRLGSDGRVASRRTIAWMIAWLVVATLWVFTRDTNAYFVLVTAPIIALALALPFLRKRLPLIPLAVMGVCLIGLFALQQSTMNNSRRWLTPFACNMIYNVFPYDTRVEYFRSRAGMPVYEELVTLRGFCGEKYFLNYPEYMEWVYQSGTSAYSRFLLGHPRWAVQEVYKDLENLFSENAQPFFNGPPANRLSASFPLGDLLHLCSSGTALLAVLLTFLAVSIALARRDARSLAWAGFFTWLLLVEAVLLFISYHGDPRSVIRHALAAVMPLRLSIWLLLLTLFDLAWDQFSLGRRF